MPKRLPAVPAILLALTLAALPLFARSAHAYVVQTSGRPLAPAIGYAINYDTYLLVWAEDRGTGTGLDLYGARLNRQGIVQGGEVPILVAPGNQSDPTLAWSRQVNEFMLFYTDDSGNGGGANPANPTTVPPPPVPGQPTPAPGQPTAPPPATPPNPPAPPPLLLSPADLGFAGRDLVGLADRPLQQPTLPIPGTPVASATPLAPTATLAPGQPTYTPVPPGGQPAPPPEAPGSRDIWGMFVTASGQRVSQTFAVTNSPADETYPDLAYMPRGGSGDRIAFVWREVNGVEVSIKSMELTPIGRYFGINARNTVASGGDLGRPSVAAEVPSGQYLVIWSQTPSNDATRDLYSRRLNNNAFPYGAVRTLAKSLAPIDDVYPSIGSLEAYGGFVMVWERRDGVNAPDIQARRLNRNGVQYASEYAFAGGPEFSFAPDIASSGQASTLAVWIDRNAASDHSILAAEIRRTGQKIGPERLVVQGGAGPAAVTPVVPGPGFPQPPAPPALPTP